MEDVPWAGRIFFSRCVESAVANPLLSKVAYHKFIFTEACRPNVEIGLKTVLRFYCDIIWAHTCNNSLFTD